MSELHLDAEALASHVIRRGRAARSLSPVGFRLDSEGINLAVTLPGPDWLAALLTLPGVDAYRDGSRLLTRPHGSDAEPEAVSVVAIADALREALSTLPERADAGEAYVDLRLAAGTSSPRFAAYVLDVVRAYVRSRPTLPKTPRRVGPKAPTKSPEERLREHRDRKRAEVRESASWALACYLDDADDRTPPCPGERVFGSALFEYAEEILASALDDFEEIVLDPPPGSEEYDMTLAERLDVWDTERALFDPHPAPRRPRLVSRQALYAVAEEQGHKITRPGRVVVLTIRRTLTRLREATMHALRRAFEILGTGTADPEEYADAVEARIGRPKAPHAPDPALSAIADALPFPVASAMASADDPRRALGLVGKAWAERHPETRSAIVEAARAFSDDLVGAVRFRVASAIEADQ